MVEDVRFTNQVGSLLGRRPTDVLLGGIQAGYWSLDSGNTEVNPIAETVEMLRAVEAADRILDEFRADRRATSNEDATRPEGRSSVWRRIRTVTRTPMHWITIFLLIG
jgi:hypothetical protein